MSVENKRARLELERLYGKESFIKKLKLREKYGEGHTYMAKNQVKKAVWYRGQQLTYHHILEKSKGGKATIENGALLSSDDHMWFHKQNKERQREMNQAFQEYKKAIDSGLGINIIEMTPEGVKDYHQIEFDDLGVEYDIIRLEENTPEDEEFLKLSDEEQAEYEKYKAERNKRVKEKFKKEPEEKQLGKAHIDEDWQKEIFEDNMNEIRFS